MTATANGEPRHGLLSRRWPRFRTEVDEEHSLADLHPYNRQSSSSPDEAPIDTLATVALQHSEPPRPHAPSCNARWHHRHTSRTADADTAAPSTHRTHNVETDSLTAD